MAYLVEQIEMGHLATTDHQRAIKRILFGLEKLYQEGKITLEVLPEADIDPGNPESKCPDLLLQDLESSAVPIVIEVATNRGWRTDFAKLRKLIDETAFGIQEGFVYDFVKGEWHKYSKAKGEDLKNPSWSNVLQLDLSKFTKPSSS